MRCRAVGNCDPLEFVSVGGQPHENYGNNNHHRATAALAQGTNAGAIPTNPGAIGTKPGAIGNGSVPYQSLQPSTGGQGLGYSTPSVGVSPGGFEQSHGINRPVARFKHGGTRYCGNDPPFCTECYWYAVQPIQWRLSERT